MQESNRGTAYFLALRAAQFVLAMLCLSGISFLLVLIGTWITVIVLLSKEWGLAVFEYLMPK